MLGLGILVFVGGIVLDVVCIRRGSRLAQVAASLALIVRAALGVYLATLPRVDDLESQTFFVWLGVLPLSFLIIVVLDGLALGATLQSDRPAERS